MIRWRYLIWVKWNVEKASRAGCRARKACCRRSSHAVLGDPQLARGVGLANRTYGKNMLRMLTGRFVIAHRDICGNARGRCFPEQSLRYLSIYELHLVIA